MSGTYLICKTMEDQKIKEIIRKYKEEKIDFKTVLENLSDFIVNFPKIGFSVFDEDICSDYYVYVLDRLPKIIKDYNENENATFKTFFYLVLRRQYLNFIKQYNKNQDKKEYINENLCYEDLTNIKITTKEVINILSKLDNKSRLLIKLRFPQFLVSEDFFELSKEFKKEPTFFLERLEIILDSDTPVPPRIIAKFLEIDVKIISKNLFNIKEKIKQFIGENNALI